MNTQHNLITRYRLILSVALLLITGSVSAQLPAKYLSSINKQSAQLENKIDRQTTRYLNKLAKREEKLRRKLARIDSAGAAALFHGTAEKYKELQAGINNKTGIVQEYIPRLDSLGTSLKFLQTNSSLINSNVANISKSLQSVQQLQSKLAQAEQVKQFIKERKEQIKQALQRYTKLPNGIGKQLQQYNKQAYYYAAQIREYKEMLNSPEKIERKALQLLNKLPAFQQFMQQNGQLARLFGSADLSSMNGSTAPAGLQTRASVQALIQQRAGAGGFQQIQSNVQAAKNQLQQLKAKLSASGNIDDKQQDFRINDQKTRSILQRITLGGNIQFTKANSILPAGTDIAFSIGYQLNTHSTIGIGASYKLGLGSIKKVRVTNEGIGLRSFVDIKFKKQLFITGGYELNHFAAFRSIEGLQNADWWQPSGLIGLTRKQKLSVPKPGGREKTISTQLLFDLLYKQHTPRSEPVKFRIGYNF
jgi:ribosomal protein S19